VEKDADYPFFQLPSSQKESFLIPEPNLRPLYPTTTLAFRVATLGEFAPIIRLYTAGSFLKITEAAQLFGLLFTTVRVLDLVWQRMG
jgi:hypothetical protein